MSASLLSDAAKCSPFLTYPRQMADSTQSTSTDMVASNQRPIPLRRRADLVVAETTCDGKKKMFELLGETKPMYVLELPHKARDADAATRWAEELRKFTAHLEQLFGITITREKLAEAIRLMNRERRLRRQMKEDGG